MTSSIHLTLGTLLAITLAACSGGDARPTLNLQIWEAVRETTVTRLTPKVERPPLTRAVLNTLDGSFMEVVLEREEQLAYLFVAGVTQDPRVGTIVTWRSEDDASLTLRNDVLIATHGIGGDLLSTDVRQSPGRIGPSGGGERRMHFLARDNKSVPVSFACEVSDLGPESVVIVERRHQTRHVREYCEGSSGSIQNDYWIDSASGLAWQSRQWAGPEIGYLRFRRLTN